MNRLSADQLKRLGLRPTGDDPRAAYLRAKERVKEIEATNLMGLSKPEIDALKLEWEKAASDLAATIGPYYTWMAYHE